MGMATWKTTSSVQGYHCDGTLNKPKILREEEAFVALSTTIRPKMTPEKPMAHRVSSCSGKWERMGGAGG